MNKTIPFFSVYSGVFYNLPESDVDLVGLGHLPLTKFPKSSCKKCHGRGYTGRHSISLFYQTCSCVQKVLNLDILKEIENKYISK